MASIWVVCSPPAHNTQAKNPADQAQCKWLVLPQCTWGQWNPNPLCNRKTELKYNLDCFSNSELDSESDEGEQNQYEHGYETLIWTDDKEFVILSKQHDR